MSEGTISPRAHITNQKIAFWCKIIYLNLFGNGFIMVANFFPPLDPLLTAEQVKAVYVDNQLNIQLGFMMMMFAIPFGYVFSGYLGRLVADIEGKFGVLATVTMLSSFSTYLILGLSALLWQFLAFRPEVYDANTMLMFNDLVWLSFILLVPPTLPMYVTLALVAFQDRSPNPIFPRWYGWLNVWATVLFLGGVGCLFFLDGPFAWDGLFAFYLPLFDFTVWVICTLTLIWKYIKRQEAAL
jgi:hypothetical protein